VNARMARKTSASALSIHQAMASSGLAAVITMTTPITQHRTCRNPFSRKGIGPAVDAVVNARSHHDYGQWSKWLCGVLLVLVR